MTTPVIQAQYERLEDVNRRFVAQSEAVEQVYIQVQQCSDALRDGNWVGQGATAFFAEMQDEILPAFARLRDALENAGQVTQKVSRVVRDAEAEASDSFQLTQTGGVSPGVQPAPTPINDKFSGANPADSMPSPKNTGPTGSSSGASYNSVLDGLNVESNPRYQQNRQGKGETYCNIFVMDATAKLGAPIPEFVRDQYGNVNYLDANEMQGWLVAEGPKQGWREVSAAEAQRLANQGNPAVATWGNPGGIGHMAMVRSGPDTVGQYGPQIAQAGATNFSNGTAAEGFGEHLGQIRYFVHG